MTDTITEPEIVSTELVRPNPALPLSPDEARAAMATYQAISSALINPAEDIQVIRTRKGPREFPKRSAFQKLANAYRVSTQIVKRELTHDGEGRLVRCDAIVRATHPDGRYAEGDGACSRDEERFARGQDKIDHDLPATAVTRATNRAISNLVAFGAVSAEEAHADDPGEAREAPGRPAWARPVPEEEVLELADQLVDLIDAVGGDTSAVPGIGQAIFDAAGGVPTVVADVIGALHEQIPEDRPKPTEATANGSVTENESSTEPSTEPSTGGSESESGSES